MLRDGTGICALALALRPGTAPLREAWASVRCALTTMWKVPVVTLVWWVLLVVLLLEALRTAEAT